VKVKMNCEEAQELLDAYSLGAVEKSEARRVEKHLASCPDCRLLHQQAVEAAALLALAAPLRRASPALRLRLRQRVAPRPALRPALRWFPAPRRSWATAAAMLAVLSLGALAWGGFLQTQVNSLKGDSDRFAVLYDELGRRGETVDVLQKALTDAAFRQQDLQNLLQQQDQAMRVVALGGGGREDLVGTAPSSLARGGYFWSAEANLGVLFLVNLSQLSEDRTYQLWVLGPDGTPVSGGTFRPEADGSARLLVQGDLGGTLTGMAITVEPASGSETPTGEIVLQGRR
jgi:anti-sigma-K factor RskA